MYNLIILFTIGLVDVVFSISDCNQQPMMANASQCCSLPDLLNTSARYICSSFQPGIDGCLIECIFNTTSVIINDTAVKENFMQLFLQEGLRVGSDITDLLGKNFDVCIEKAKVMVKNINIPPIGTTICNRYSSLLLGCIYHQSMMSCPANKWQNISDCVNIKDYFTSCPLMHG